MSGAATILWCSQTPPEILVFAGLPVRHAAPDALQQHPGPISALALVIELESLPDLDALLEIQSAFRGPSLWLVPGSRLSETLLHLPPHADCALDSTPTPLLNHRLQRLIGAAAHDPLTGLLTRAAFAEAAGAQLAGGGGSLLIFDIDHFKAVNDTFGHTMGDRVLTQLAALFARLLAPAPIGRIGGEEIATVLPTSRAAEANAAADALRASVEDAEWPEDMRVTVSVGVASASGASDVEPLLRGASDALYAAKAAGRNTVVHHDTLTDQAREQNSSVEELHFEHLTQVLTQRFSGLLTRRSARAFEAARTAAETDGVTHLPTRRQFDRRFSTAFANAYSERSPLSVALIDIDHFGDINKTHGWPTGDAILARITDLLQSAIPEEGDTWLARYGGDELILVNHDDLEATTRIALDMHRAVTRAAFTSTRSEPLEVTLSAGVATFDYSTMGGAHVLLERASDHLLEAKRGGRNRVVSKA